MRFRAPAATAAAICPRTFAAASARTSRPEGRRRIERITEPVLARQGNEGIDKARIEITVNIDPLDRATRLAGVEHRSIDEVLDRRVKLSIRANEGRILAAQLKPGGDKSMARCPLDGLPAGDRAGEGDKADSSISDHLRHLIVIEVQILEDPSGSPASRKASAYRSATCGVCGAIFSTTLLPARIAGTTALTEASHG
jgi:hypothetical protein